MPTADHEGTSPISAVATVIKTTMAPNTRRRPTRSARNPTRSAPNGLARNDVANTAKTRIRRSASPVGGNKETPSADARAPKTAKSYHSIALAAKAAARSRVPAPGGAVMGRDLDRSASPRSAPSPVPAAGAARRTGQPGRVPGRAASSTRESGWRSGTRSPHRPRAAPNHGHGSRRSSPGEDLRDP